MLSMMMCAGPGCGSKAGGVHDACCLLLVYPPTPATWSTTLRSVGDKFATPPCSTLLLMAAVHTAHVSCNPPVPHAAVKHCTDPIPKVQSTFEGTFSRHGELHNKEVAVLVTDDGTGCQQLNASPQPTANSNRKAADSWQQQQQHQTVDQLSVGTPARVNRHTTPPTRRGVLSQPDRRPNRQCMPNRHVEGRRGRCRCCTHRECARADTWLCTSTLPAVSSSTRPQCVRMRMDSHILLTTRVDCIHLGGGIRAPL